MTQAVGYIRVSTADQADNGVSLEAQRKRIEAWAVANGYELTAVHVDAGLSGKRADNRPALQDALTDVTACRGILVCLRLRSLFCGLSLYVRRFLGWLRLRGCLGCVVVFLFRVRVGRRL